MHYDAIVLGLGGMGSAAFAALAARGARVLGLEQFSPAHALGSSHGQTRVIRQAYFEHPSYVPLAGRAFDLWEALERTTGRRLLQRTGVLVAGHPGSIVLNGSIQALREHSIPHDLLSATEMQRRFPAVRPRPDEAGVFEPGGGVLFPEECVLAQLQAGTLAGGEARFGVRVSDWHAAPDGTVTVTTPAGEVSAARLLLTAGPWFTQVAPDLGLPLVVERQVMHWFRPLAQPESLAPGHLPVWIRDLPAPPSPYGFPILDGATVKVAFHHGGIPTTPDSIDRSVHPDEIASVRAALAAWLPDAAGAHVHSTVCMYTNTPDDHFVIGLHPRHPSVVLAGGFSGHGFKFCPMIGEILADLALDRATPHPIDLFSPTRFAPPLHA